MSETRTASASDWAPPSDMPDASPEDVIARIVDSALAAMTPEEAARALEKIEAISARVKARR